MTKDYGKGALLSYNKYLRVPELIELQTCLSSPAQHDELLFITVHQAYELWFKQILHEIDAAIVSMKEDRIAEAVGGLRRVGEIEKLLITQIHILETMMPLRFLSFRDELNPASGFQSMQFREIEFSSGLKDEKILRQFGADDFAHKRLQARMNAPCRTPDQPGSRQARVVQRKHPEGGELLPESRRHVLRADILDEQIDRKQRCPADDRKHCVVGCRIVRTSSGRDALPFQNDADDPAHDGEKDEKRERDKGKRWHRAALSLYQRGISRE